MADSQFDLRGRMIKNEMLKYLFFGGLNTLLAYLLFAFFIWLGFHYTLATLFPGMISIYIGYVTNKKIVFDAKPTRKYNLAYYYLFYVVVYFVNISIQALLNLLGFNNDYINGAIATMITVVLSFSINKWFFFKKSSTH